MNITKPHILLTIIFSLLNFSTYSQITTNSNVPYSSPIYLVDSLLLGEGVIANNHTFQGDPLQIGFFNGENSNVGLDREYNEQVILRLFQGFWWFCK